jgi:hypothetical protein
VKNNPQLPAEIFFAWLNGRADKIEICQQEKCYDCTHTCYLGHECRPCPNKCEKGVYTKKVLLWHPEDAISIEQAILNYGDNNDIDIRQEAEPNPPPRDSVTWHCSKCEDDHPHSIIAQDETGVKTKCSRCGRETWR